MLHFHGLNHHQNIARSHGFTYFGRDRDNNAGQRRGQASLYGGRRELFQARIIERDVEMLARAPQVNVGAVVEVAGPPACFVEANGDVTVGNR